MHLSAGDLLRAERESGSALATMINEFIRDGKIVPAEITVGLLKKAMFASGGKKFLIDGFPRNLDNLASWNSTMAHVSQTVFMLFLDCPEKVMESRLLKRGETSGRNDDNAESIRKRYYPPSLMCMPELSINSHY